jgi:DNA-directed RNA polymerase subunit alpha
MQIKVENGRGTLPGNQRRYGDESPKSTVSFFISFSGEAFSETVESARVEQRTDLDKWFFEIENQRCGISQ